MSSRLSGAYAGRLLVTMGAQVDRVGPAIELAAPASAAEHAVAWVHEGKTRVPGRPDPADVVAGVDLVLLETDGADPEWVAWGLEVAAAADALSSPPVVVSLAGAMIDGEPIPSDSLTTGAWAAMSWSIGDADKAPLALPFDLADFQLALYGTAAGLIALLADPEQKELRHVDVAGRDVLAYYVGMITANFLPYERPWTRDGARPPGSAGVYPASIFPSSDGHVVLMCRNQKEWHALLAAMGNPEWSRDPKFDDPRVVARLHSDEADEHLIPWIASHTAEELVKLGRASGLAVAPILSVREAIDEPQFAFRDFYDHDASGLRSATVPWQLSQTPEAATPRQWAVSGEHAEPTRLLDGLRVLDLSWVWSGPLTTSVLGDLGAEVLKVEHSGHMDTGRHRGRARRNGVEVEGPEHEATPYFNQMNHGKRSITLDMKRAEARAILLDLVEQCDVIVENMRPGVLARLGLSYDEFAARNPAVVMLSMSMAGQEGPLNSMKGYAGIMAAMSGLESLIGYDKGNIVGSLSPALGDPNAAGHALCSLLGALVRRRRTGHGCWIDLSQIEALMCVMPAPIAASQIDGDVEVPVNTHPLFAPYGHFPAAGDDRWIALAVRSDDQWAALSDLAAGVASWAGDERWQTAEGRCAGRAELETEMARWTAGQDRDVLVAALLERGIAAAPVASFEEMTDSDWVKSREFKTQVLHRYLGKTDLFVAPFRYGGRPVGRAVPAPMLGADTDDILSGLLGMEPAQIAQLHAHDVLI
ncbi:CoA transferase [Nocardioides immobilis]|uniref:CoA transferase n=1 Tax=Nocardioides immobilis TaxID=2049295 RepID=A0A417Y148_9ACTN|nr:CoA transferase [Nocardioides immobilis]